MPNKRFRVWLCVAICRTDTLPQKQDHRDTSSISQCVISSFAYTKAPQPWPPSVHCVLTKSRVSSQSTGVRDKVLRIPTHTHTHTNTPEQVDKNGERFLGHNKHTHNMYEEFTRLRSHTPRTLANDFIVNPGHTYFVWRPFKAPKGCNCSSNLTFFSIKLDQTLA